MYQTLNGYTKQSMINKVKIEFKGKAVKCTGLNQRCLYLTDDGKKCAVGIFIPDGHVAQRSMDIAIMLLYNHKDLISYMPLETGAMRKFQHAHDLLDINLSISQQLTILLEWIDENVK